MSRQRISLYLAMAFLVLQSSCSIFRKGSKSTPSSDTTVVIVLPSDASGGASNGMSAEKKVLIAALLPLWQRQMEFTTFSGKAKMHYEGRGQKQDFTAHFRIKKDEVIWATITALGGIMQVARIHITQDSFRLINYLEKEVTIMPLSDAIKVLPVPADFSILQNLIVGNSLRTGGTPTDAVNHEGAMSLQVEEKNLIQQIVFNKSDSTMRALQLRTRQEGGPAGVMQYNSYERVQNQRFPSARTVNVNNEGEQFFLDMNFNNVELDKSLDFPFSIPKNYKRK